MQKASIGGGGGGDDGRKRGGRKKSRHGAQRQPDVASQVKRRSVGSVTAAWSTLFDAAVVALVPHVTSTASCQSVAARVGQMGGDLSVRVVRAMRRWRLVQDHSSLELVARLTTFFDPPSLAGRHHLNFSEWTHLPYEALHTTATLWSNISSINVSSPKAQAFSHIRAALDDAWLGELAKSPAATQHIRELNLSGCSRITVQGLRHLKAFPHLRKLCLKRPESRPDLGEDDVELFDALDENCPMLEYLILDAEMPPFSFARRLSDNDTSKGSGEDEAPRALPHLRRLRLPEIPVHTLELLWRSGRLASLHELDFKFPRIQIPTTTSYVSMLADCPHMRNAVLTTDHALEINQRAQVTGSVPPFLAQCVRLRLDGPSLSLLQHCPLLEKLSFYEGAWTFSDFGAGFPTLVHLRHLTLEALDIIDPNADDQPAPSAAETPVAASSARIMWRSIFSAAPGLQSLKVIDCDCGTVELADSLRLLTDLRSLTLTDLPGLTVAVALEAIAAIPSLRELVLELEPDPTGAVQGPVRLCHARLEHANLSAKLYAAQPISLALDCPRLRSCELSFDRLHLAAVADSLRMGSPLLRHLALGKSFDWPAGATTRWLCELVADFPLLRSLSIVSRSFPPSAPLPYAGVPLPLTHVSLRILTPNELAIRQFLQACPQLRCLDASLAFSVLAFSAPALPSVTVLRLNDAVHTPGTRLDLASITPNVEEVNLSAVVLGRLTVIRCHALRTLEMQRCPSLDLVEIGDAPRLETIRFDGPRNQQPVWKLQRCPLVSIVSGFPNVTYRGYDDYLDFLDEDEDDYHGDYDEDYYDDLDDMEDFYLDEEMRYYEELDALEAQDQHDRDLADYQADLEAQYEPHPDDEEDYDHPDDLPDDQQFDDDDDELHHPDDEPDGN